MMYRTCPYCGAHLDFGETCECTYDREQEKDSDRAEEPEDKKQPVAI